MGVIIVKFFSIYFDIFLYRRYVTWIEVKSNDFVSCIVKVWVNKIDDLQNVCSCLKYSKTVLDLKKKKKGESTYGRLLLLLLFFFIIYYYYYYYYSKCCMATQRRKRIRKNFVSREFYRPHLPFFVALTWVRPSSASTEIMYFLYILVVPAAFPEKEEGVNNTLTTGPRSASPS